MRKFLIIFTLSFVFFSFFISWITPCYKNGLFEVRKGESLFQIAENLKKQEFIQLEFPFYIYVLIKDKAQDLKSGVYLLSSDETFFSIAKKIIHGETYTIKVTIPEGYSIQQIDNCLTKAGLIQQGELISNLDLEGYLFPDTYYFSPSATIKEIVKVFLDNFDKKLNQELKEKIEKQNESIHDIITMASLIEKEVRGLEDKKIVSDIFWKRIKQKIPLDSCATIAFILGEGNWTFEEMRKEIAKGKEIDSPYNTYKYLGLPIGPICNPGLESIIAAIEPKNSEYWYYLSTPEGKTIFSKTLEEHNIAKAKYLK